ncbi:ArfGap-domain-containing protein [Thelephora ganbajun]|uniref:ArfGap-domain-containing protein n=1 Tax=Thelephora ganbajun TaxID=370292 RepID=A0ACB6ZNF9_THEGA|nr:ArfGap-domain-containing protein [Thelephora ganbajun]
MDQAVAKKTLQELIRREDLKNKICADCSNPNPQWASLSFAIFLCLQCAGTHRGFGVHVSFVRSVSMDTWQEDQVKRMTLGGNGPFLSFVESYAPVDQGGYKSGMSSHEKYHCWAATQYKSKLDADLAGKPWSPSAPPKGQVIDTPSRPSSAQGLRKSRTGMRTNTRNEHSPSPGLSNTTGPASTNFDQKTANEQYFAGLGQTNALRPEDLPPSQGGRYQGFGNTPSPPPGPGDPSFHLSSRAVPTFSELQENPMGALGKGWSFFSSAVSGATRAVNESIIQPGVERATDPNLQASIRGYVSEAGKYAGEFGKTANTWSRNQFGVDVAERVTTTVRGISGGPERQGYGSVPTQYSGETSGLYQDDDDIFKEYKDMSSTTTSYNPPLPSGNTSSASTRTVKHTAPKKDDWDDWKDF